MMNMGKIKHTFDIVVAVEMAPAAVELVGGVGITEPNGKHFLVLGEMRASAVVTEDVSNAEAEQKAIKTACYFWKQKNEEWVDSRLVGLSPTLVRRSLVR